MQRGDRVGGRFEIVGEAARGGMGTVFRARDVRSKREVAIKMVEADDGRFAREATILAGLHDPRIVEYVSHGRIPDGPSFLVMEWVDGETLSERLIRKRLAADNAVAIVSQIARALVVLHGAGVVHRDVKPSNIMLVDHHAKLVDFGIARRRHERLTITGGIVGTAGYMAPEQARGDTEIDERADVFALGCVAYECLAGTAAFRGDSALALQIKVLIHDPPRLASFGVMAELDALVARMLDRDHARRPSARDVVETTSSIAVVDHTPSPPTMATSTTPTVTTDAPVCAVLIAFDDRVDAERAERLGATYVFDGGAIAIVSRVDDAAALAVTLAHQIPTASVALAAGDSPSDAIDRTAKLIERLDVAAASGAPVAGAWVDVDTVVPGGFVVDNVHERRRLRGALK